MQTRKSPEMWKSEVEAGDKGCTVQPVKDGVCVEKRG